MEARVLHDGRAIHFIPDTAITAGSVVVLGHLVGITKLDVAAGELGVLSLDGVYEMPKDATALSTDDFAYWDQTNRKVGANTTGTVVLGRVVSNATATDTMVQVRLEPATP